MSGLVTSGFELPVGMVAGLVEDGLLAVASAEQELRENAINKTLADVHAQIDAVAQEYREKLQQLKDEVTAGEQGADSALVERLSRLIDQRVDEFRRGAIASVPTGTGLDTLAYVNDLSAKIHLRTAALRRELALALPDLMRDAHREAAESASREEVKAVDTLERIRLSQLDKKAGYRIESRGQVDLGALLDILSVSAEPSEDDAPQRDLAQAYFQWAETVMALMRDDAVGTKRQSALSQQFAEIHRAFEATRKEGDPFAEERALALLDSTQALLNDARHHAESMRALYGRYLELAAFLASKGMPEAVRELGQFEDESELEAAIADCESRAEKIVRDEYIARALDEIMAAHGYSAKRAIVLESGALRDLYLSDSSDAAVSVGTEGDRVFMLTAKANASEYDDASEEPVEAALSPIEDEAEKNRQYRAQQHFCTVYDQIVKELAERGITLAMGEGDRRVPASPDASLEVHRRGSVLPEPAGSQEHRTRDRRGGSALAEREMS